MGNYLNPSNEKFKKAKSSEIYIDKSELIQYTNKVINTTRQFICVSRPRRFGKSMAADMITAYYSRGCDSDSLFSDLRISRCANYKEHLNKYDVISINMQEFLSRSNNMEDMLSLIKRRILWELLGEYPDYRYFDETDLAGTMQDIYQNTHLSFVIVIDEWDCVFREYKLDREAQEQYLDFLRDLLKDKGYIDLAYMTGILPIKKYGTHSALNMFSEYSMMNPGPLAEFVGFTKEEVIALCEKYNMNIEELKEWYDGYHFEKISSIFSPRSVIEAVSTGICDCYWNQTETFEALRFYIDMNFDGLKDDILTMMSGKSIPVNTGSFSNDMTTFHNEDDVLTLLIHLGYLGYDFSDKCVFIPNQEIMNSYVNAVTVSDWGEVSKALKNSADTLNYIWEQREDAVAQSLEQAHFETSHLQYNDENALSYTISLALYAARNFYILHRELPTGKGFADMIYIPKKQYINKPAMVIELKWNKSAKGAIAQIKEKKYCKCLEEYRGNILLVGVNYDKKTKTHTCIIDQIKIPE